MDETSSFGRQEEKSSSSHDMRRDARFRVNDPESYRVVMKMGHIALSTCCTDYSPFGLGLRLAIKPDLPLLSIGEAVELNCDFSGSRFNARGTIANTRVERSSEGDFVRVGISLSRSAEVVRPAHVKRRSARIQMSEGIAPLVSATDELRFGETVFAKMTDVSLGGMRLTIDRHPLPFMEKQKHWFEIDLPAFGHCKAYCRIAYVRRDESTQRYIVGCEFIDGGREQELRPLEDWLFYGHLWLSVEDIKSAGFPLVHLAPSDEKHRVFVSAADGIADLSMVGRESQQNNPAEGESIEFSIVDGTITHKLVVRMSADRKQLMIVSVFLGSSAVSILQSFWKALLIFALHNQIPMISLNKNQTENDFFKASLGQSSRTDQAEFFVMDILARDFLKLRIWRRIYTDLKKRNEFALPAPISLLRRAVIF